MSFKLKVTSAVKGHEGIFRAKGTCSTSEKGEIGEVEALVKDIDGKNAELIVDDSIRTTTVGKYEVEKFSNNTFTEINAPLKQGSDLEFRNVSVHPKKKKEA